MGNYSRLTTRVGLDKIRRIAELRVAQPRYCGIELGVAQSLRTYLTMGL